MQNVPALIYLPDGRTDDSDAWGPELKPSASGWRVYRGQGAEHIDIANHAVEELNLAP